MARPLPLVLLVGLAIGLSAAGCGNEEPGAFEVGPEQLARIEDAYENLHGGAVHDLVVAEVLKTCDKWRHIDRPCVDEEIRVAQLECWLEAGQPEVERQRRRPRRPRATALAILLMQNLCLEKQRWRKLEGGPDF